MATAREAQVALKRSPIYRFGDREVDTRLRQIKLGGELLEAQPKAFDLLVYLIENRNRVVDKDELLEQLWAGSVVSGFRAHSDRAQSSLARGRRRRSTGRDSHGSAARVSFRGRRAGAGPAIRRAGAATSRGGGRAIGRRAAVRGHEPGARPGVLLRRDGRGDHHRAHARSGVARRGTHVELRVQESRRRRARDRSTTRCQHGSRGQRPQGRQSVARHGAAHRRRNGVPSLVRALGPNGRGHARDSSGDRPANRRGVTARRTAGASVPLLRSQATISAIVRSRI